MAALESMLAAVCPTSTKDSIPSLSSSSSIPSLSTSASSSIPSLVLHVAFPSSAPCPVLQEFRAFRRLLFSDGLVVYGNEGSKEGEGIITTTTEARAATGPSKEAVS